VVIRYADDLDALCRSQQQAQQVLARLADWSAPRGLAFNQDKTTIVHPWTMGWTSSGSVCAATGASC
jgi:RNA-directed DNA polymerase